MHTDFPLPVVVGLIRNGDDFLLLKRVNPPYKNQWVLPGGKWEKGETLMEALLREIYEETSYEIEKVILAAVVSVKIIDEKENLNNHYILFFHVGHIQGKIKKDYENLCWANKKSTKMDIPPVDRKLIEIYYSSNSNPCIHFYEAVIQEVKDMYRLCSFLDYEKNKEGES
ncbi:MAG: NUDIX hydrolase [Theionarchaea archaeon]|nr:NUDIX hydrolase [Theionarchaea archaeon]